MVMPLNLLFVIIKTSFYYKYNPSMQVVLSFFTGDVSCIEAST